MNMVMNLRVQQNVGKFLSNCTTGGFSRRAQLHAVSCFNYGLQRVYVVLMIVSGTLAKLTS
jgi:hypothetical protein